MPHGVEICSDREQARALCLREHARSFRLATSELGLCSFERAQALFPFALEAAGNQAIIGIPRAIATLGPSRRVARSLNAKPPLLEGRFAIGLQALGSSDGGGKPDWLECRNEGACDGLIDLDTSDVETVAAAPVDKVLAAAMVAGSRVFGRYSACADDGRSGRSWRYPAGVRRLLSRRHPTWLDHCAASAACSWRCVSGWLHR